MAIIVKCKISFLVLENLQYEILLGLDYFRMVDAGVFPKREMIYFPKENSTNLERIFDSSYILLAEEITMDDGLDDIALDWEVNGDIEIKTEIVLPETIQIKFDALKPLEVLFQCEL
jgi:hypothetical protein